MVIMDGDWRLFDHDLQTGRSVWRLVEEDGREVFRVDYPVDKMIESNTAVRNNVQKGFKGDYHLIASIPLNIAHDSGMVEAMSNNDNKFMSRWLNDSDNRAWRTKDGNL